MTKSLFTAILAFISLVCVPAISGARVFYVSPDGSGTECTQTNPCGFQTALDTAKSNNEDDTINLLAGTYEGNFRYSPTDTEHKSITIQGASGTRPQDVILDGQASGTVLRMYDVSGGDIANALIEGLTIKNGMDTERRPGGLYVVLHAYNITVSHCVISGNAGRGTGGGALIESDYTIVFENNIVYDNLVNERQYGWGYGSRGGGVAIWSLVAHVRNNLIYGNRAQAEHCTPQGGGLWSHVRSNGIGYFINNTIARNEAGQGGGVYLSYGTHYLYNNIVSQNDATEGADIYIDDSARGTAYHNDYTGLYGSWEEDGGNIAVDPRFVNPDSRDFHISDQSQCIDAGMNDVPDPPGLPDTDFEGDQRIMNGTVDMGADEYSSQGGSYTGQNSADIKGVAVARMKNDGTVYFYLPSLLLSDNEGRLTVFRLLFKLEDIQSITFRLEDAEVLSSAPGPTSAFFDSVQGLLYIAYLALIDEGGSSTIFKNFTFGVGMSGNDIFISLRDFLGDEAPTITEYIGGTKEVGSGVASDVARRYLDLMAYIENLLEGTTFTTPQPPAQGSAFDWDVEDW